MNNILSVKDLEKKYVFQYALKDININLIPGRIYGFVGENGAGKTTLFQILTGLAFPTYGTIQLFGKSEYRELQKVRGKMGSIIENPTLYPNFSAFKNLRIQQILTGTERNILELLELVGLSDVGNKKVRNYSLGMKQRLALALSLVNSPEILLLDEPTNGLDPQGIADLRELLVKLQKAYNITIFVSSHNLNEMFLFATDYIFIHKGHIIKEMSSSELENLAKEYSDQKSKDFRASLSIMEEIYFSIIKEEKRI